MARVTTNRTAAAPVRTGALRHARTNEQRKSYKVIIEEMTEKKKKLHTTLSFKTQAPPGYTFVAAGNPKLTLQCKDVARKLGLTVYIVSTSKSGSLKEQVGRLGYHFPSAVVGQARRVLGSTLTETGNVPEQRNPRYTLRNSRRNTQPVRGKDKESTRPRAASISIDMDQSEIDSRAAIAIRELFPKIPEKDVHIIVAQAFQKGANKVGTAFDQPFIRRVHLAVGAYIRHTYTDYDRLLKSHGYLEARAIVEPLTLDKVLEWRDEKDDADAVEDILREVIVISDDEDEGIDDDSFDDRDSSVEIASSREISHEVHVQPIDYSTLDQKSRFERPVSPEEDWAPAVKFIRRLSPAPIQEHQDRVARHHAQRYQKWQEAIDRSRQKEMANRRPSNVPNPMGLSEAGLSSVPNFGQPINARRDDNGPFLRSIDRSPRYEYNESGQSSRTSLDTRRWAGTDNLRGNFQSLGVRPEKYQAQDVTLSTGATHGLRPAFPVRSHEQLDVNRQIAQRPGGIIQRPSFSQPAYFEPDRPIPSVERDLHTPGIHQQYTGVPKQAAERWQLQDRYLEPRIVELDDGPASPAYKRRRIADDVRLPSEVTYSPRRMELVPIASQLHRVPNNGSFGASSNGDAQQRPLTTQERRVPGAFPETGSEYQQRAIAPSVQSQSRFINEVSVPHLSHVHRSGRDYSSEVHESSGSLRPVFGHPTAAYAEESRSNGGLRGPLEPLTNRFQEEPTRLKPSRQVDRNAKPFPYGKPATGHACEVREDEQPFVGRVHNLTSRPPLQDRDRGSNLVAYTQPSKLDCPMAARGSFCNRLRENGFIRKDHLDEHMRLVHRMGVYPVGMEILRTSSALRAPLRDHQASENSHVRPARRPLERADTWQKSVNRRADQEQEIVYISSSPLAEERPRESGRRDYTFDAGQGPPLLGYSDTPYKPPDQGRRILRPGHSQVHGASNEPGLPRQIVLLD